MIALLVLIFIALMIPVVLFLFFTGVVVYLIGAACYEITKAILSIRIERP